MSGDNLFACYTWTQFIVVRIHILIEMTGYVSLYCISNDLKLMRIQSQLTIIIRHHKAALSSAVFFFHISKLRTTFYGHGSDPAKRWSVSVTKPAMQN